MLETSARLLRLLSLLQTRPEWPGAELAQRLAVTPRTLRRDVRRLRELDSACRGFERLTFRYSDHHGAASDRTIEPYRLVSGGYRWYLMAFDLGRDDWRTLRVDRISELSAAGRFAPRDAPEPISFVRTAITTAPYRYQAKVVLYGAIEEFAAKVAPTTGVLTPITDDRCLLTTGSDSLDAMVYHLLVLGADFTVLEPPELITRARALANRLTRATDEPTRSEVPPDEPPAEPSNS